MLEVWRIYVCKELSYIIAMLRLAFGGVLGDRPRSISSIDSLNAFKTMPTSSIAKAEPS